jgi:hypothetical protein
VSYDDVVGRVTVEETVSHAYPEESGLKITYMLHGTGVGSGQVWKEERLFATREEAAEFCDRTNRPVLTDECEMLPEVK